MKNEILAQKLSEAFDGGRMDKGSKSIDRDNWAMYSLIGDVLRGGYKHLTLDVSKNVFKKLSELESVNKSKESNTLPKKISSFLDRLKIPKPSPYQFASLAIVFSLGVSVDNIIERSTTNGLGHEVYVEGTSQLVGNFEVSEQLESECDISEVSVDGFIMQHERLSGSPSMC
jgi:hypothetical protein